MPQPPKNRRRPQSTVKALATTAVVAYGAYKIFEYFHHPYPHSKEEEEVGSGGDGSGDAVGWRGLSNWISSLLSLSEEDVHEATVRGSGERHCRTTTRKTIPNKIDPRSFHRLTQQGLRKCREESLKAYGTCWPALQIVIDKSTDTASKTKELRLLRRKQQAAGTTTGAAAATAATPIKESKSRQDQLWKEIQLETLTKLISTEYASSLLLLSLTMQLHWIGGQVFQRKQLGTNSRATAVEEQRWAQEVMMESHQYMAQQGVPLLIAAVRRALLSSTSQEWTATTFISKSELEKLLLQIDQQLQNGAGGSSHTRNWIRLVLPDPTWMEDSDDESTGGDDAAGGAPGVKGIVMEALWDLAESPAWQDAQTQTLHIVKQHIRDDGWGRIYSQSADTTEGAPASIPLAKLMAPFKTACSLVAFQPPAANEPKIRKVKDSLPQKVQRLATVLELGDVSFRAELQ
jgi:hypothetical protein